MKIAANVQTMHCEIHNHTGLDLHELELNHIENYKKMMCLDDEDTLLLSRLIEYGEPEVGETRNWHSPHDENKYADDDFEHVEFYKYQNNPIKNLLETAPDKTIGYVYWMLFNKCDCNYKIRDYNLTIFEFDGYYVFTEYYEHEGKASLYFSKVENNKYIEESYSMYCKFNTGLEDVYETALSSTAVGFDFDYCVNLKGCKNE